MTGLRERDTELRELMDDPDCDPDRLAATLRRFGVVNRLVSGWGGVYRTRIRPFLAELDRPARILDLGSGGGDLIERLARAAQRDGVAASWVGADPDARAHAVAWERAARLARTHRGLDVRFRRTDARGLLDAGERFDLVISNHVLHHLDDTELRAFARDSRALSHGLAMHADIERHRVAHTLYGVGILPLASGTLLRTDGLRSIQRSFRAPELAAALASDDGTAPSPWRVERPAPFRLLAVAPGLA